MRAFANPNQPPDALRLGELPEEPATRTAHGAFTGFGIEGESSLGDGGDGS
jgi:hypothetical protein